MGRILSLRIRYRRRQDIVVLVTLALVVMGYLGYLALSRAAASALEAQSSPQAVTGGRRNYYKTSTQYYGDEADGTDGNGAGVCERGYHFASLWELLDTTNLEYNGSLGWTKDDIGQGPAAGQPAAWARTGSVANPTSHAAGLANCDNWASRDHALSGTGVWLDQYWEMDHDILAWEADNVDCDFPRPVWCVEDIVVPGTCGDPLPIACGQQVTGNNASYPNSHGFYSCGYPNETGPEVIYSFELPPGAYDVSAQISGFSKDLDVFLLGDCDLSQCIDVDTYGDDTATASGLGAGLYYIVVDGYLGATSDYTLELSCSPAGSDSELQSSPQAVTGGRRNYYKTSTQYYGDEADGTDGNGAGVCEPGYHFASLWEIMDTTNLEYNGSLGWTTADRGQGPAAGQPAAWARTGGVPDTSHTPGQANCGNWTSRDNAHGGTGVWLDQYWEDSHDVLAWEADNVVCDFKRPVWCVEDIVVPGTCGDPLTIACGQQVTGNNATYPSIHDAYSCGYANETGPEVIYSFELPPGPYDVSAQISGFSEDLDVFLLGDCDLGQCIGTNTYGDDTATASGLGAGLYYIVVDGYDHAASDYTLELGCSPAGLDNKAFLPLVVKE